MLTNAIVCCCFVCHQGLDEREIDALASYLNSRQETEPSFIGQLSVAATRKQKAKTQVLIVTVNRVYLMRSGSDKVQEFFFFFSSTYIDFYTLYTQAEKDGHLRDLLTLKSLKPNSIELEVLKNIHTNIF